MIEGFTNIKVIGISIFILLANKFEIELLLIIIINEGYLNLFVDLLGALHQRII